MKQEFRVPFTRLLLNGWVVYLSLGRAVGDEPKNRDFDVIRDEASRPPHQLPPVLAHDV